MPGSHVIALRDQESIFSAYNAIFDQAVALDDVEGVILMHDDAQITDGSCEHRLRDLFADPSIGLVGVVGGSGRGDSIAYWGREHLLYLDGEGYADPESHSWGDVDIIDGYFMAVPAEVARTTRFDLAECNGFHRYDAELSCIVRANGRRVSWSTRFLRSTCTLGLSKQRNPTSPGLVRTWSGE